MVHRGRVDLFFKKKKLLFFFKVGEPLLRRLSFPRNDEESLASVNIKKSLGWKYMVNQNGLAASLKVGYFVHIS